MSTESLPCCLKKSIRVVLLCPLPALPLTKRLCGTVNTTCAVRLWSFLLRVVLPSLLYLLLPCAATARWALSRMCEEPDLPAWNIIPLTWR